MTIVWSRRATEHLIRLRADAAREHAPAGAIADRILLSVNLVAAHPYAGRPGRLTGTRELAVPQTKYVLAYRLSLNRLDVVAILTDLQRRPKRR